jgi:serine/threonine protein kinase
MSPQRWNRVREVFDSAVERLPAEADEFLRRECGDDAELYSEVRQMLEQHRQAGFLDRPRSRPAPSFQPGDVAAGRYRILRLLGRGGMGQVYEAEDTELRERMALKTLLPEVVADSGMVSRFKREIQLARKIGHPNVCRVFDLARHPVDGSSPNPALFLTMEFLEGETLAERIDREGRIAPVEALGLIAQMADALDAAHRAGIIHRDFKPSNVMLVPGERGAVVTDFGLARTIEVSTETTATATGQLLGTIDYMAPELFAGEPATPAADQYALALVAYKMVAGKLPFQSDSPLAGVVRRAGQKPPSVREAVPELDPVWDQAFARALDPDSARRFATCTAFVNALRGRSQSVTLSIPRLSRRRTAALALAAVLLAAAPFTWRAWQRARSRPSPEAEALYQQGAADLHAGAYFAATKALAQAVTLAPHFTLAHARLAEAWVGLDLTEKATQEMLTVRRQDLSALSRRERLQVEAIDLTITREFAAAAAKYEQAVAIAGPAATDLYVDLGRAWQAAGKPDKAIEAYKHAAESAMDPAAWLRLAVLYSRAGDTANADAAFTQAEQRYQLSSNLEGLTEVLLQRGIAANRRGDTVHGRELLQKAIATAEIAGNLQQKISARLQLASGAYLAGDAAAAEQYAGEALQEATQNRMEILAVVGLMSLGNAHVRRRDYPGTEKYLQQAVAAARQQNSPLLIARSLLSLASLHDQVARYAEAGKEAQESASLCEANRLIPEAASALTILGRAQAGLGDAPAAMVTFHRLLDLAERNQDKAQIAVVHESIGTTLSNQGRYPEALLHFQQNLELCPPDSERAGYARLQCGETLGTLGRYQEAETLFAACDPISARFPALRLRLLRARGEMELSRERYRQSAAAARTALADAGQDPALRTRLQATFAAALIGLGKKEEGLQHLKDSAAASAEAGTAASDLTSALERLQAEAAAGRSEEALAAFHRLEPAIKPYPEFRWRALALLSLRDRNYAADARASLDELHRAWGDAVFETYLSRPDLHRLSRPLFQTVPAKPQ